MSDTLAAILANLAFFGLVIALALRVTSLGLATLAFGATALLFVALLLYGVLGWTLAGIAAAVLIVLTIALIGAIEFSSWHVDR